jgi:RNA-binding protein YlmH
MNFLKCCRIGFKNKPLSYSKLIRENIEIIPEPEVDSDSPSELRLSKYLAKFGVCSRRQADELIKNEKLLVNNKLATLGTKITPKDKITLNGRIVKFSNLHTKL